ncbi:MAG: hypothetical protein MZV70_02640 [Desulfobacterales bacterium]|nr:hypothetical protein [Desulfobacterales bacterium]
MESPARQNRGSILLIDDEANILGVLAAILGKTATDVQTARSAEEDWTRFPGWTSTRSSPTTNCPA